MRILWTGVFLAAVALISWGNGTYRSEFGRLPDEGMHYITGLLIRDFLASGDWSNPMQFALDYYAHFPKVGLGNWPPVFEILEAFWSMLFGVSRLSMMWGMSLLTAALAAVTYREAARHVPAWSAVAAALVLIAAPLTQEQASMVMAEMPLALFSFLAILAWQRFADFPGARTAVIFGLLASAAILTKGNGWVVPLTAAFSVLLHRQWTLLRRPAFWLAAGIVAILCIPYTLFTMSIVVQGWNERSVPSLASLLIALRVHHGFVVDFAGWPLYLLMWVGVADRVIVPLARRRGLDPFWSTLLLYFAAIVLFHATVPTSYEPRKIYQIAPVFCVFLATGLARGAGWIAAAIPRLNAQSAAAAAILVASAAFGLSGFRLIQPFAPGFVPALLPVLAAEDSRGTAILISSDGTFDDSEAAIIAEWASRQRGAGTYLVRANKLLSRPVDAGGGQIEFKPYDETTEEVLERLRKVPIAYVIVHSRQARRPYAHHAMVRAALEGSPEQWDRTYIARSLAMSAPHTIEVFHNRMDVRGIPVRLEIDLSEKLGAPAVVETGGVPQR